MSEAIKNIDGTKKQRRKISAAKRFITHLRAGHPRLKFMICGVSLMSHQPMIEITMADMHPTLFRIFLLFQKAILNLNQCTFIFLVYNAAIFKLWSEQ